MCTKSKKDDNITNLNFACIFAHIFAKKRARIFTKMSPYEAKRHWAQVLVPATVYLILATVY
jgi:hypothetical protein